MSNFKRGYLNREEENFYMVAQSFIQMIEGTRTLENKITEEVWLEWAKRGMITPGMQKNLKMVHTYLKKYCYEIEENLDKGYVSKLNKKLIKFDFKIVDDYTMQKLFRDMRRSLEYAVMERDKFLDILEDISAVRCVGCTDDYKSCKLCKAFEDISIPYVGEQANCPYAADLCDLTNKQKKEIQSIKNRLKRNNKFFRG